MSGIRTFRSTARRSGSRRAGVGRPKAVLAGTGALLLVALTGCGSDAADAGQREVVLVAPLWANGQANVAVAAYLLEKELGYKVTVKEMTEEDSWKAMDAGKADVVLEDWDVPGLRQKYVIDRGSVVSAGELGVTGRIGWYVPRYLADEDRSVTRWENLNKKVHLFSGKGSGGGNSEGPGILLQGDPSYKSHDTLIIQNLDLNYKLKHLGSEDAQLEFMRDAAKDEKPFLTYWWTPHWVDDEIGLAEVRLPEHFKGCDEEGSTDGCGYPETELEKFVSADFAKNGGRAAQFIRNFEWGEEEQNAVAKLIAGDKLKLDEAAAQWTKENEGIWNRWLWDLDD